MTIRSVSTAMFVAGLALLLFVSLPVGLLLGPQKVREYVYREIGYRVIVDRVTTGLSDEHDIAMALFDYMTAEVDAPRTYPAVDVTVWNDLLRGTAWCDQQAWGLSTLLARKNIPSSLLMLRGHDAESHHTVATAYINGRWRILDPFWRLVFKRPTGRAATFDDLQHPDLRRVLTSEKAEAIDAFDPEFSARYFSLFEPHHPPVKWMALTETDHKRRLARQAIEFYVDVVGPRFVNLLQNAYLLRRLDPSDDGDLFWRARHYHVFFRHERARAAYERLLAVYPQSPYREDALYFLGRVQQQLGDWPDSVRTFDRLIAETGVNPKWQPFAYYYIGVAMERAGDTERATEAYWLATGEAQIDAAIRFTALVPGRFPSRQPHITHVRADVD